MNRNLIQRMRNEQFHYVSIDLFSGPGGLCTGFKWAGILPLIAVEWTDSTVETYSQSHNAEVMHLANYIEDPNYLNQFMQTSTRTLLIHGDINLVDDNMIRDLLHNRYGIDSVNETIDIVSGGAPCESFSMAGTRTVGDERDDLFDNIVRISRTVNTKAILFENVKGMLSKPDAYGNRGSIFQHICNTFDYYADNTHKLELLTWAIAGESTNPLKADYVLLHSYNYNSKEALGHAIKIFSSQEYIDKLMASDLDGSFCTHLTWTYKGNIQLKAPFLFE